MRTWTGTLRSRVARRVFLLFVLSALVPIAASALITFSYVRVLITQQTEAQLRHAAKSYGMNVFERLLAVESRLHAIADYLNSGRPPPEQIGAELSAQTLAVIVVQPDGRADTVIGSARGLPEHAMRTSMAGRNPVLLTIESGDSEPGSVWMLVPAGGGEGSAPVVAAQLRPAYIWGSEDVFPIIADFCVLSQMYQSLFCSRDIPQDAVSQLAIQLGSSSSGELQWNEQGQDYVGAYWELFLTGRYPGTRWTVVSYQSEGVVLVPINRFKQVFPLVVLLSILVVILLSSMQIRRRLVPLEQLTEATRRVANQDFATDVAIESGDEFEELGDSFNAMTRKLGQQFRTLTLLSELDRLILANSDEEYVIETALQGLLGNSAASAATIGIVDRASHRVMQCHTMTADSGAMGETHRAELESDDIRLLLDHPQGLYLDIKPGEREFLTPLASCGAVAACVIPVLVDKQLSGIVCLGYTTVQTVEDPLEQLGELADRLAVAWSATQREEQLYTQAHYDQLTRLPNRQLLFDRVEQAIARAKREDHLVALLFLDLDRFKNVNDTLGHAAGDTLLQLTAQRLLGCVRETDTVARLGGDEFTIVLPRLTHPRSASMVAEQVINTLSDPFAIGGNEIFVSASIGIVVFPDDGDSAEQLMKNADTAMYRAKDAGRSRHMFFEDQMNVEAMERASLERDLRYALDRAEFLLHYQPQIDLVTGEITGAEALLRWPHPVRGLVPPSQFIQLAEDTGLVESIGQWVLRRATLQLQEWHECAIGLNRLAINVSSRQFMRQGFVDVVHETLRESGVSAECLELEITESLLLEESIDAKTIVGALHALGVSLSLDDFGTGYSSLTYLRRFPFATLKIDQSFVRDLPADQDSAAIATSIIALAASLRKEVIAEGVETQQQVAFLRDHNCGCAQGFFFSRPLAADEFARFYREHDPERVRERIKAC